jgi:uroporphyrinogen decarboxylase
MTDTLSKRERVEAALSGQDLDRVPVAAWGHLLPAEIDPVTLGEASLDFFHRYDWDWLKVNPRASLFAEAWGSRFDLHDYHNVLPRFVANPHDPIDWNTLPEVTPDHPTWAAHLQTLRTIKRGIGGAPFVMTLFSPASVLAYLAGRPTDHSLAGATRAHADALLHLIRTQPAAAHHALGVIADSLAALAVASLEAGELGDGEEDPPARGSSPRRNSRPSASPTTSGCWPRCARRASTSSTPAAPGSTGRPSRTTRCGP